MKDRPPVGFTPKVAVGESEQIVDGAVIVAVGVLSTLIFLEVLPTKLVPFKSATWINPPPALKVTFTVEDVEEPLMVPPVTDQLAVPYDTLAETL